MKKTFEFQGDCLECVFTLRMDIKVLPTEKHNAFVEFESTSEDLIVEHSDSVLNVASPFDEELVNEAKNAKNFGDVVALLLKSGARSKSTISGKATIYIPTNLNSLFLKSNRADIALDSSLDSLNIKLNNGSITLLKPIQSCNIKGNRTSIHAESAIKTLYIHTNRGSANLIADAELDMWDIESNRLDIVIKRNDFSGNIYQGKDSRHSQINNAIRIKTRGYVDII